MTTDTTAAKRQQALRARRLAAGLTEVRGIYLPQSLHAKIKNQAAALKSGIKSHKEA